LSSVVATGRDMSSFIASNDNPVRPHLSPGYPQRGHAMGNANVLVQLGKPPSYH
jgi:hypothetical protein